MPVKLPLPSKQYVRDLAWIERHLNRLTREYPNQWVAVRRAKIVAADENLGKVKATIQGRFGEEEIPVYFVDDGTIILIC